MEKIVQYLGSGKIYKYSKSAVHLSIVDFSDITNRIIPLIKENPLVPPSAGLVPNPEGIGTSSWPLRNELV